MADEQIDRIAFLLDTYFSERLSEQLSEEEYEEPLSRILAKQLVSAIVAEAKASIERNCEFVPQRNNQENAASTAVLLVL
ncbi:hypothetical protein [Rhizobium halophilum]|uniref:hypothetical protein n=1 Tax=Rhizobium halophilum TaxID=2846852 RepID=UPI001EFC4966|nr:hypothetical protein [Rhizobium halophilum]MCF6369506.1 hypothetical protein [Rhizobium halophilum]